MEGRNMKRFLAAAAVTLAMLFAAARGYGQGWSVGGNMGLSLLGGSPGFHLTPMAERMMGRSMAVGTEFSLNTQFGVPLLWYPYVKYYFPSHGSKLRPYVDAGPLLILNVPGAPDFGILFGGGVNIHLAGNLSFAPDVLFGPVFGYGGGLSAFAYRPFYWGYQTYGLGPVWIGAYDAPGETIFALSVRAGLRYEM